MEWGIFDKYLSENIESLGECVQNHKNTRMVYKEEVNGEVFYIKKYIMKKRDSFFSNLGIKNDSAKHYEKISEELEKTNILHIKSEYISVKKEGLFRRTAILVMKDGGTPLDNYIYNYKDKLDLFKEFFNIFIRLCQNGIYSKDYNLEGALLGNDGKLRLIDFDKYRIKKIVTKKFKKKLIDNLRKNYIKKNREKGFEEFLKKEIIMVIKELKWEKDIK